MERAVPPAAGRAKQLIDALGLIPHPEGGRYREQFRSAMRVRRDDAERSALTTIYFLLTRGECSRWHRVTSDEAWHFYEGDPLELLTMDDRGVTVHRLARVASNAAPVQVVPANVWQAARPLGEYTLVGCSVGPGFDFADFAMLDDLPEEQQRLAIPLRGYLDLV